ANLHWNGLYSLFSSDQQSGANQYLYHFFVGATLWNDLGLSFSPRKDNINDADWLFANYWWG
ncbi:MAG TPA: hypothetical protein QGG06_03395, partial [Gammaproteobacteria bacterium]|nr:hypothetical protein [Gammaproteobacteria bacterium]